MRLFPVLLLLGLAVACGAASRTAPEPPASRVLMGRFKAESDTARQLTGDVLIEHGGLVFENGVILYTRVLNPRRGGDLIARDGDSYAAVALGPGDLIVELRRVTEQVVEPGAHGLCGDAEPEYAALVHEERATSVTLMVFAGAQPPGPDATDSALCATYAFAAPDGARTRQGVLLR